MMYSTIISTADARALGPAALFVDCRHDLFAPTAGYDAFLAGHPPRAVHLHMDRDLSGPIVPGVTGRHPLPSPSDFIRLMGALGLRATTQVVAYDDKGGGLAARLWWMLRALGHEAVAVLDGGIQAWTAAGYPMETGPAAPRPDTPLAASHLATSSVPRTCDRAQIAQLGNKPSATLVDSRTAERYRGEHEPIDPVAGHIPGAINLPWPENLRDGKFKSVAELKTRFAALGDEAGEVVFYCGSGVTACHNLLAFEVATGRVGRLYPGSWSEYLIGL